MHTLNQLMALKYLELTDIQVNCFLFTLDYFACYSLQIRIPDIWLDINTYHYLGRSITSRWISSPGSAAEVDIPSYQARSSN
jgi:hypothetical protein